MLISGTEPSFTKVLVDSAGEGFLICCKLINDDNLQDVNIAFVTLAKDSYDQSKNVPQEAPGSKPCTHPKKIIFVKIKIKIIGHESHLSSSFSRIKVLGGHRDVY